MIILRHTTLGRTPLGERSTRRRDLYLTTHNTHKRQTSMPPGGIWTHRFSKWAPTDPRLRPRGHWGQHPNQFLLERLPIILRYLGLNSQNVTRRRYVVKHNVITEVYLMTVMETTTCFGLCWPSSGCLGNLRASSTLSFTSALYGDGWSTPRSGRFTPRKDTVPIV